MYSANVKDSENGDRWLAALSSSIVHLYWIWTKWQYSAGNWNITWWLLAISDLFCLKIMCLHVNKLKVSEVFLECVRHQRRSVGKLSSTKSTLRVSPAPSGEGMLALIAQLFIRSAISSFSSDLRRFSSSSSSSRKIEWNQWNDQDKNKPWSKRFESGMISVASAPPISSISSLASTNESIRLWTSSMLTSLLILSKSSFAV